jgi:hypothetical protein
MKNDLTTGAWQHDIGCPISIVLFTTSDVDCLVVRIGSLTCRHIFLIVYVLFYYKPFRYKFRLVDGAAAPWELEDPLPLEEGRLDGFKGGSKRTVGAQQSGGVEAWNVGGQIVGNQLLELGLIQIHIIKFIFLGHPCAFWPWIIVFCLLHPMLG